MMQPGGDYSYYPHHHPPPIPLNTNPSIPNPIELPSNPIPSPPYASAPPYTNYSTPSSDYAPHPYASSYPSYPHNPDPVPPVAPSHAALPPPPSQSQPKFSPLQATPAANAYSPLQQKQVSYYPHDNRQSTAGYLPPANQTAPSSSYSLYDSTHQPAAGYVSPPVNKSPSLYPSYDDLYQSGAGRFDYGGGSGGHALGGRYDRIGVGSQDDVFGEGAYAYDGGRSEPYGARGTKSSSSCSGLDDYGRSTNVPTSSKKDQSVVSGKIAKAVPKVETEQDSKGGVQKFRVKLLSESPGQSAMDVICQIGLDGIRMLDPSTNRTLRIYPLETVTRWEGTDSSIYSFWAKSQVDIEPRRIRLQSNKYTTNTILDTVAAAAVQFKELGVTDGNGTDRGSADHGNPSEPEKKKGILDWMNSMKPINEEKDHWVPDEAVSKCTSCSADFGAFLRKHHCRNCGDIFCDKCTNGRIALTTDPESQPVRVCAKCMTEVTRRLIIAKESANKPAAAQTHEDLARKLQEEMAKRLNISAGWKKKSSGGSGRQTKQVACPTCTVHLQVELPDWGSETFECGVCQHPFIVSAR